VSGSRRAVKCRRGCDPGWISLAKPRVRGANLGMGVAAMVMGAVGVMVCFFLQHKNTGASAEESSA
jgi:hypothetical protein